MCRVLFFLILAYSAPANAATYLSGQKLADTLSGKTYTWYDGSTSTYHPNGSYVFSGQSVIEGSWAVKGDRVCVTFSSGGAECSNYYYQGGALYARTAAGKRIRAQ